MMILFDRSSVFCLDAVLDCILQRRSLELEGITSRLPDTIDDSEFIKTCCLCCLISLHIYLCESDKKRKTKERSVNERQQVSSALTLDDKIHFMIFQTQK